MNEHIHVSPEVFAEAEKAQGAPTVTIDDLKAIIADRDRVIAALNAKCERLTLAAAQAIAREKTLSKPKGFVNAKKRRRQDERTARTAIKEALRV